MAEAITYLPETPSDTYVTISQGAHTVRMRIGQLTNFSALEIYNLDLSPDSQFRLYGAQLVVRTRRSTVERRLR